MTAATDATRSAAARPRLFSGMQPTQDSLHIGNYLGALVNWVALQSEFDAIYSVVDLHSLTVEVDPQVLRARTRATAAQYIAGGVDPAVSAVFVQSHVPEHAELTWLLSCITGFGEAGRMTQFKDKSAKRGADSTNVGLFTYPILMAADILLYDAARVPVGEDQRQHLELSRNLAQRFNARYGDTFTVPEPHILKETAKIQDLQNPVAKMSKTSPAGTIDLLADPKQTAKRIRSAVTDTEREIRFDEVNKPGIANLLSIYSALDGRSVAELEAAYEGKGYGDLKKDLAEVVVGVVTPIRERSLELLDEPAELDRILADGADRIRPIAAATLDRAYERVGLLRRR
ncbi:MAG: tryptophan--tRNA ligase [Mobilicoccus sp.]|nr:tryptophan--tRNA ligase [Mobilicoccus sp.]